MFEKDSEIMLNMSGNYHNLSSNFIFNDINNKNVLCTSTENFTTKFKDLKPTPLLQNNQHRLNTPIHVLSSSDKLLKDNTFKTSFGLQHKKSEQFSNNKSELLTIRSINDIISVILII